jgi:hypothetical protein
MILPFPLFFELNFPVVRVHPAAHTQPAVQSDKIPRSVPGSISLVAPENLNAVIVKSHAHGDIIGIELVHQGLFSLGAFRESKKEPAPAGTGDLAALLEVLRSDGGRVHPHIGVKHVLDGDVNKYVQGVVEITSPACAGSIPENPSRPPQS